MSQGVWTNNWRGVKNAMLMGAVMPGLSTITSTTGTVIPQSTPGAAIRCLSPMGAYDRPASGSWANYVSVGTGVTAPAATDIALATNAGVSYLAVANEEPTYDAENGVMSRVIRLTIQNNDTQKTITEWGVFNQLSNGGGTISNPILLYRELLDVPVTLAPYDAATLALTLTLTLDDPL